VAVFEPRLLHNDKARTRHDGSGSHAARRRTAEKTCIFIIAMKVTNPGAEFLFFEDSTGKGGVPCRRLSQRKES
jgi:hypothetical protein